MSGAISCPACGGANEHDAVFCAHCNKALGPFRYVREELDAAKAWHESLAERVTDFIGRPHFFFVHIAWFALWIGANAGIVMAVRRFDVYPYSLLGILLAIEAIFITGFLLISQNRQQAHMQKYAELDYEVNVRSYREVQELKELLSAVMGRLDTIETAFRQEERQ